MVKKAAEAQIDVVGLVSDIVNTAVASGASDIHIEPKKTGLIVRIRVDGVLKTVFSSDADVYPQISSRIKVMANLETTGQPRPQEGHVKYENDSRYIDLRISFFPTSLGEAIVIRLLESDSFYNDFSNLGYTQDQIEILNDIVRKPYGLILVTGPNGAGKSSTLFTFVNKLNSPEKSIVTLEDPVERKMEMVRQTEIDPSVGLTFADGLRYLLRQDPDVIMVGEIRDRETAAIAVQAAITGHLVLATIHTNNAAGAIVRLVNMGVEPFLLASALKFVTAQRLARLNCPHCKEPYQPSDELLRKFKIAPGGHFFHSTGCSECNMKGFKGRIGLHELLVIDKPICDLIMTNPTDDQINELALRNGMQNLRHIAMRRVEEGIISLEEALRLVE